MPAATTASAAVQATAIVASITAPPSAAAPAAPSSAAMSPAADSAAATTVAATMASVSAAVTTVRTRACLPRDFLQNTDVYSLCPPTVNTILPLLVGYDITFVQHSSLPGVDKYIRPTVIGLDEAKALSCHPP
eukprot:CAMPEP_0172909728 /NCGR_PEP_ID=MMETSP1075-20121228/183259_1 /TAXON_ID=2916 /ORGANISM="Ceratium fusus, Strain PA161109" /LENGTH=132 /DNA_ID=CAMNT_0013767751 /DNA_START=40 /DNA_END=434 /DNA_ORIENTATION=+